MTLYYLIKDNSSSEPHLVMSLDGHDDCEILEKNVTAPKIAGCERVNGRWRINRQEAREAIIRATPHDKLVKTVMSLETRLKILENLVGESKNGTTHRNP